MSACSGGELVPSMCEDAFRYPIAGIMAKLSRKFRITIAAGCVVHDFINMAIAEVVSRNGRKLDLRHFERAVAQRSADGHREGLRGDDFGRRGCAGADDRCDGGIIVSKCGVLHRAVHERSLEAPCLL